jgi:mRNA interferase RelE/StbE
MFQVFLTASAEKQFARLSASLRRRMTEAFDGLRENPRPRGCVKLKGEDELWRIRVGDYRVVYTIQDDQLIVLVVRVAHRKDVYQG